MSVWWRLRSARGGGKWAGWVRSPPSQRTARLGLDRSLIDQHDWNVIFDWVHAIAFCALQALWILAIFERLLVGWANQHFQKILGNHAWNYKSAGNQGIGNATSLLQTGVPYSRSLTVHSSVRFYKGPKTGCRKLKLCLLSF